MKFHPGQPLPKVRLPDGTMGQLMQVNLWFKDRKPQSGWCVVVTDDWAKDVDVHESELEAV